MKTTPYSYLERSCPRNIKPKTAKFRLSELWMVWMLGGSNYANTNLNFLYSGDDIMFRLYMSNVGFDGASFGQNIM
jgi:hypothetical protein